MRKRLVAMLLAGAMVVSAAACGGGGSDSKSGDSGKKEEKVALSVTTTFAGEDGNAQNYKDGVKAFEEETGIKINDASQTADEAFKARVSTDFQSGSEPDVLFYYTGADANTFIEEGKVVSLEEIRKEYPDYASNLDDEKLTSTASLVDGKNYVVPTNGYWEAMFVNKKVLADCGIEVPGADYTWEQFMNDCKVIKDKGYAPVAAALGNIPHYWWEFCIFNNETDLVKHTQVPENIDGADAWVNGMEDVKAMYEAGCFPENTLSATDDETFQLFMEDKAAFLLDGSWKAGGIAAACQSDPDDAATLDEEKLANYTVTYVPAKGARKASDLIGGFSMGYYITKKAWDDEAKRDAAVKFIESMTTDEMISKFALVGANPLKNAPQLDESALNSLQKEALKLVSGATSYTGAVQDLFPNEARVTTFDGMPKIVTGDVKAKDAVKEGLEIYAGMQ